jgi:hypothetical protein
MCCIMIKISFVNRIVVCFVVFIFESDNDSRFLLFISVGNNYLLLAVWLDNNYLNTLFGIVINEYFLFH